MVEAMYERSPGFFKQFQKNFKYFISEEKPNFSSLKNFAFCMHFESVHCDYNPTNHYHVLIDVSEFSADFLKQTKPCSVPCLFTTFKYLFSSSDTLEAKGDVFQKLLLAVEYNKSNFNGFSKADTTASIQKRLPIFTKNVTNKFQQPDCLYRNFAGHKSLELNASKQKNQPIQTDQLTTETLKRFQSILSGPHVGAFCQVMNIFISGYGKLEIDSDVLCVRFLYEEKIKF